MSEPSVEPFDYAYTDRDVREDEDLRVLAINYVNAYGGEFTPLVEAREYLREYGVLSTPIARKVLNCMRHDASVAYMLPRPKRRTAEVVVSMAGHKRKQRARPRDVLCENTASHHSHWQDNDKGTCPGIPFPINRELTVWMKAVVNAPYIRATGGKNIHIVSREKTLTAWRFGYRGWPNMTTHEYGQRDEVTLDVKLVCRYPSYIVRGDLLTPERAKLLIDNGLFKPCKHCFNETQGE